MEQCANTAALNKYMEQQEQDELEYEQLLEDLRDADPEDYEEIIYSHGYGDANLVKIMEDL